MAHCTDQGFGFQHHAGAASERRVVDAAMAISREIPKLVQLHAGQPGFDRPTDDAG